MKRLLEIGVGMKYIPTESQTLFRRNKKDKFQVNSNRKLL